MLQLGLMANGGCQKVRAKVLKKLCHWLPQFHLRELEHSSDFIYKLKINSKILVLSFVQYSPGYPMESRFRFEPTPGISYRILLYT